MRDLSTSLGRRRRLSRSLPLAAVALLLAGPALGQGRVLDYDRQVRGARDLYLERVREELERFETARRIAWERDDAPRLAEFYAADAVLHLSPGESVTGREAIREHFARALPGWSEIVTSRATIGSSGDLAYETRHVSYRVEGPAGAPALFSGVVLTVYRRENGSEWKIQSEMVQGVADSSEAAQDALALRRPQVVLESEGPFVPARTAVSLSAGTLGVGVEVSRLVLDRLALRVGVHGLPTALRFDYAPAETTYGAEFRPLSAAALLSFFPLPRSGFHLSGGVVVSRSDVLGTGKPSSLGYLTLNSNRYRSEEVGPLSAEVEFPAAAPYAGIGVRPLGEGFLFEGFADLGVAFGTPSVALSAPGAAADPQLAADLQAEREVIQAEVERLPFYPVFSWSLSYRF